MTKRLLATTLLASLPMASFAYETGDWIIRGGAATVEPDESSSTVAVAGAGVPNTGVGLSNDTQLGLTVTYILSSHIGLELLASTPFEHDVTLKGDGLSTFAAANTTIASVEHLPPTLSLQYFFMQNNSAWQPYVGLGINYWMVLDEELSGDAKTALGANNLEVDDSIGIAFQAGMDFSLGNNWLVNAAIWYVDIETDASFDTAVGKAEVDIDVDPWVYMLGVGYSF